MTPGFGHLKELRARILFLLGALIVYRIGAHVPVPGIDPKVLSDLFRAQANTILNMFNLFSGGALQRFTVFALGIMPYISASIIMQILGTAVPKLEELRKEGESGRRKLNQYTRYASLALAIVQAFGIAVALESQAGVVLNPGIAFKLSVVITLASGTMFLVWLGDQITERGLGNGISMIIFAGIVAELPHALGRTLELSRTGAFSTGYILALLLLGLVVVAWVVFMERAQRRIPITYARQQVGRHMMTPPASYLPLKLNSAGVIPPIFASSIILLPATLASWFGDNPYLSWMKNFAKALSPGEILYMLLFAMAIFFFAYFYTAIVFNPKDVADNLKKSGALVPGIRPGEQTLRYIDRVLARLTLIGAAYITIVCLLPEILIVRFNAPFHFGGTSLLIVVVVTMDFMAQVQAQLMATQYESLLKKANFRTGSSSKINR
jgi:preprotein translocase subunit SecY